MEFFGGRYLTVTLKFIWRIKDAKVHRMYIFVIFNKRNNKVENATILQTKKNNQNVEFVKGLIGWPMNLN